MADLSERSVEIILGNQHPSGAYVASPNFAPYRYCWFRDGAYIAYSMDLAGVHASAQRFHLWAADAVKRRRSIVLRAVQRAECGERLLQSDVLHTRYTLEGDDAAGHWENFQLDGFGSWLWSLAEHVRMSGGAAFLGRVSESIELTVRYLSSLWSLPNFSCWEEHPDDLHPYSLAAIHGGLRSIEQLTAQHGVEIVKVEPVLLQRIRSHMLAHGVHNGHWVKRFRPPDGRQAVEGPQDFEVDASLVGLATPYGVIAPDDPTMRRTVRRIEDELHCRGGGVHRYRSDTYYGGGEWVLLAAWLGWFYAEAGEIERARELLRWVEDQADPDGGLPEQVSTHLLAPEHYGPWVERWGPVARPLLWSHAMHLILCRSLEPQDDR